MSLEVYRTIQPLSTTLYFALEDQIIPCLENRHNVPHIIYPHVPARLLLLLRSHG